MPSHGLTQLLGAVGPLQVARDACGQSLQKFCCSRLREDQIDSVVQHVNLAHVGVAPVEVLPQSAGI